jgi:hypothetical protein
MKRCLSGARRIGQYNALLNGLAGISIDASHHMHFPTARKA